MMLSWHIELKPKKFIQTKIRYLNTLFETIIETYIKSLVRFKKTKPAHYNTKVKQVRKYISGQRSLFSLLIYIVIKGTVRLFIVLFQLFMCSKF